MHQGQGFCASGAGVFSVIALEVALAKGFVHEKHQCTFYSLTMLGLQVECKYLNICKCITAYGTCTLVHVHMP